MSKNSPDRLLVIGVGNPDRGDDAAGHAVIRALRDLPLPNVELKTVSGEATGLIEAWSGADRVVVVDASRSVAAAGTITRYDAHAGNIPAALERTSTHGFGVAEVVALALNLDRLPPRLDVYAIEGKSFKFGDAMTADVDAAARRLAKQLADLARLPDAP